MNIVSSRLIVRDANASAPDVGDDMRHSWILDVLSDLQSYAELNNLPGIAAAAKQTLGIAEAEIEPLHGDVAKPPPSGGPAD